MINNGNNNVENNKVPENNESLYKFLRYLSKWETLTLIKDESEKKLTLTIESGKMQSVSSYEQQ